METLTTTQALKAHVRDFNATRACKTCGSFARHVVSWSASGVLCTGCEVAGGLSLCKVNAKLNSSNKAKKKLLAQPGPLPVVFSGMNTNKR